MKVVNKALTFLIALAMVITMIPGQLAFVWAAGEGDSVEVSVGTVTAQPGQEVDVKLNIANNPGILGASIKFTYDDSVLTMLPDGCVNGDVFTSLAMTKPGKVGSGCKFIWDGIEVKPEDIKDGEILTLRFAVADSAVEGRTYDISASCDNGDFIDGDMNALDVSFAKGGIKIQSHIWGDLNDDKKVNTADIVILRRYLAGGYDVNVNDAYADINQDGKKNTADVVLMRRYLAGYDVTWPDPDVSPTHTHTMKAYPAVEATCTEPGNIAYWQCTSCEKYFSDGNGMNEIQLADTVVEAKGHTIVIIPAVAPTTESEGWTEGKECSVCGTVLVEPQVIPKLDPDEEQYAITYHIYEDDKYLKQQDINNPNPTTYTSKTGLKLKNLSCEGYAFEGWYDGEGTTAEKVKEIPAGSTGEFELYAHWTVRVYTISFDSSVAPIEDKTYKVNEGATLTDPHWFGYTFTGWTDEDGNIVTRVPKGTTGNMVLTANWTSERNQTIPEKSKDVIITEDEETGTYLFTYKIGRMENVPLYTLKDLGNRKGLNITETYTVTDSMDESSAKEIAEAISEATTRTQAWTLSETLSKSCTVDERHLSEMEQSQDISIEDATNNKGEFYIGGEHGGSHITTTEDGKTSKVGWGVNGEIGGGNKKTAGISFPVKAVEANLGVEKSFNWKIGANYDKEDTTTHKDVTTDEQKWNINAGFSAGYETAHKESVNNSMRQKVADEYGYSTTVANAQTNTNTNSLAQTNSKTREYSSVLSYSKGKIETTTKTIDNSSAPEGYYRIVAAGTVDVFAVVGYDVANKSYFTYTYNVLRGDRKEFVDYSKVTSNFDDNENGILPFTVPDEVKSIIDSKMSETKGLVYNAETGTVTGYNGTSKDIVIPEYKAFDNGDGSFEIVKITGISSSAFAGKNIETVQFSKYIESIPTGAFKNCTSLKVVDCPAVKSIGANAFNGCTSLNEFLISTQVTSLGSKAFDGVEKLSVEAVNDSVAEAAINSGAKNLVLSNGNSSAILTNKVVNVPSSMESFKFNGMDKTYSNMKFVSYAGSTEINGVTINADKGVPIKTSSSTVIFNRVNITAPDIAVVFTGDETTLKLERTNTVTTAGTNAILSKGLTVVLADDSVDSSMVVRGNLMYCGALDDKGLISYTNGRAIAIDESTYEQLLNGSLEWVLESEVPAGATVINTKWTYDETTTKTSSSNTMEGYTLYDTTWAWGAYGSWSSWSKTKVTSSDSRQVETRNIAATYKTQYNYSRWASNSNNTGNIGPWQTTWGGVACNYYFEYGWVDASGRLPITGSQTAYGTTFNFYGGSNGTNQWFNETTRQVQVTAAYTEYRYRDRSKVYTYHFKKVESKESTTEVTAGGNIDNVQKWVQYVI